MLIQQLLGKWPLHAPETLTLRRPFPLTPCASRTHGSSPRSNCVITPGLGPACPAPRKKQDLGLVPRITAALSMISQDLLPVAEGGAQAKWGDRESGHSGGLGVVMKRPEHREREHRGLSPLGRDTIPLGRGLSWGWSREALLSGSSESDERSTDWPHLCVDQACLGPGGEAPSPTPAEPSVPRAVP